MAKTKQKKKRHVPVRLNILFFAVFILFSALILRLGFVQIVEGEEAAKQLERTSNSTARIDAPRGIFYDRYQNVVVDNELELSVTYTNPSEQTGADDMLAIARDLEKLIDIDTDRTFPERDKQDFWLLLQDEETRNELVSKEERDGLDSGEQYQLEIDRVTEEHLNELTEEEIRVFAIFREMRRGYANTPQRIKRGITEEEAHRLSEKLDQLPGVDILRDSRRNYVFGDSFRTLFGSTGQIQSEKLDYYLSRGYERSDIVGTSFLEAQYENVLRGEKAVVENITTSSGGVVDHKTNERLGQRGNDLIMTLDMEMQQKLEDIVQSHVTSNLGMYLSDRSAYAVMMDPRTGDVLAMAGYNDAVGSNSDKNDDHLGTINKAFEMAQLSRRQVC